MRKYFYNLLILICLIAMHVNSSAALAASQTLTNEVTQKLEKLTNDLIARYIPEGEFQVIVEAEIKEIEANPLPYVPETLDPLTLKLKDARELSPYITRLQIQILLAKRFGQATQSQLQDLLQKRLPFDSARGDKISFDKLSIDVEKPLSVVQQELQKAEADLRDSARTSSTLMRERDDAKRDLSALKSQFEALSSQKKDENSGESQKNTDSTNEQAKNTTEALARGFFDRFGMALGLVLIGITLVVLGFLFKAGLALIGRHFESGLSKLASGIENAGGSLAESSMMRVGPEGQMPLLNEPVTGSSGPLIPIDQVAKRVLEIHTELVSWLSEGNDTSEAILLEYLANDLTSPGHEIRAVAVMELFGKDNANDLFHKLPRDLQESVFNTIRVGYRGTSKGELMIEAGEELKTRLLGSGFLSGNLSSEVARLLPTVRDEDLAELIKDLDKEQIARLYLYLNPIRMGRVLNLIQNMNQSDFEKAAQQIVNMSQAEDLHELDQKLLPAITRQTDKAASDRQRPYFGYYKTLIANSGGNLGERLAQVLSDSNARVGEYLREHVVTFATYFSLHGDIQEEIVEALSNKELASLLVHLEIEKQQAFNQHLDERRLEIINDEIALYTAMGHRKSMVAFEVSQKQIIKRIELLKGAGQLSEILDDKQQSGDTNSATGLNIVDGGAA